MSHDELTPVPAPRVDLAALVAGLRDAGWTIAFEATDGPTWPLTACKGLALVRVPRGVGGQFDPTVCRDGADGWSMTVPARAGVPVLVAAAKAAAA